MPGSWATWLGAVAILWVGLAGGVCFAQGPAGSASAAESEADAEEEAEEPRVFGDIPPKPLMTLEEEKAFRTDAVRYTTEGLKSANPNASVEALIDKGVRYRVYRMTLEENSGNLANLARDLVTDLETFAGDDHPRARGVALASAVKYLSDLLDQPLNVRLSAVYLLGRLTERNGRAIPPPVPPKYYVPAGGPLMQVVADTQQPVGVKIAALYGLGNILRHGDARRQEKDEITRALVDALDASEALDSGIGRDWYQWRLVDTLGLVKEARTIRQEPLAVDAMWKVMHDPAKGWWIRTRALRSLSQLDLDTSFNIGLLVHQTVEMTGKMGFAQRARPQAPQWPLCFTDVYFAFHAEEQAQREAGWGLRAQAQRGLRTHQETIDTAYQAVLPIINAVTSQQPAQAAAIGGAVFRKAGEWIEQHKPPNLKLHEGAEPVQVEQPSTSTPEGAATSSRPPQRAQVLGAGM